MSKTSVLSMNKHTEYPVTKGISSHLISYKQHLFSTFDGFFQRRNPKWFNQEITTSSLSVAWFIQFTIFDLLLKGTTTDWKGVICSSLNSLCIVHTEHKMSITIIHNNYTGALIKIGSKSVSDVIRIISAWVSHRSTIHHLFWMQHIT